MIATEHTNGRSRASDHDTPRVAAGESIRDFLALLHRDSPAGSVFEVRALQCPVAPGKLFTATASGYYPCTSEGIDAAAKDAARLDTRHRPPGVYVTLNPARGDLLGRANCRIEHKAKSTTGDGDVIDRRWLFIDIDPVRPSGVSATAAEHEAAVQRVREVWKALRRRGWPEPVAMVSGNGAYLLYRVDLPADDVSRDLVKAVLVALAAEFDDDAATIDTSTFNASRILKVAGTTARKGDDLRGVEGVEDRPHRVARLLHVPDTLEVVGVERLHELVDAASEDGAGEAESNGRGGYDWEGAAAGNGQAMGGGAERVSRCRAYLSKLPDAISGQGGHNATLTAACECVRFDLSDTEAMDTLRWWSDHKSGGEPWTDKELRHKLKAAEKKATRGERLRDDAGRDDGPIGSAWDHAARAKGNGHAAGSGKGDAPPQPPAAYAPPPLDVLPATVRDFTRDASRAMGCDPAMVVLPLLAMLAACVGNARRIRIKMGWCEPCIVWAAVVGESGTLKTPAQSLALRPLHRRDADARREHAEAMKAHLREVLAYDRDLGDWKKGNAGGEPPEKPEPPPCPRTLVSDTTVEALARILAANPRGVLLARDELAGWVGSFNAYKGGKGGDDTHWLSMHTGQPMVVDRVSGGTTYAARASVSVCGGIQPGVLARAFGAEHRESGMLARVLLAMPPRKPKRWTDAELPERLVLATANVATRLLSLELPTDANGEPQPVDLPLTRAGKVAWVAFYDDHNTEAAELHGDLAAAWSKLEGYAARFALLLQLVEDPDAAAVDEPAVRSGVALARWFAGEARRVYAVLSEGEADRDLRELVELIRRKGGSMSGRELVHASRRYATVEDAEGALQAVVDAGWGRWEQPPQQGRGRPPARRVVLVEGVNDNNNPPHDPASGNSVDVDNVDTPAAGDSVDVVEAVI